MPPTCRMISKYVCRATSPAVMARSPASTCCSLTTTTSSRARARLEHSRVSCRSGTLPRYGACSGRPSGVAPHQTRPCVSVESSVRMMCIERALACVLLLMLAVPSTPVVLAQAPAAEGAWDAKFRDLPDPAVIKETMRRLSARPHHVGSPYDKDNAEGLLAQFTSFGWDAQMETFDVLFPTPKTRVLEMTAPARFTAKLEEPPIPADPTSNQKGEQLPTYNAYSIDGDVTGPLVYVNYGRPVDYEALDRRGVSVKGAIVIARYGASRRGIKPKVAAEHGAIGCLIYSGPPDDR